MNWSFRAQLQKVLSGRHRWITKSELGEIVREIELREAEISRQREENNALMSHIRTMEHFVKAGVTGSNEYVDTSSFGDVMQRSVMTKRGIEHEVTFRFSAP